MIGSLDQHPWRSIGQALILSTIALMPCRPGWGGVGFWLLALTGLLMMTFPAGRRNAASGRLWAAAAVVFGVNCLSVVVFDQRMREAVWYPLLALPMLIPVLARCRVDARHLVAASAVGCAIALAWVLWLAGRGVDVRASLGSNAIIFGETTLALVLISVLGRHVSLVASGTWMSRIRIHLLNLAALLGFAAVMVVGYRGALLALPLFAAAIFGIGMPPTERSAPSWLRVVGAIALVLVVVTLVGPKEAILERIFLIQTEVETYASGHIGYSSLGSRIELWQAALSMFADHPLFGIGVHRFSAGLELLRSQGHFPRDVLLFEHAHNSYLTVAAEFGVVGLAVFVGLFIVLVKELRAIRPPARVIGLYLLALWLIMALTNDVLAHQATMRAMVIVLAVCLAAGREGVGGHASAAARPVVQGV